MDLNVFQNNESINRRFVVTPQTYYVGSDLKDTAGLPEYIWNNTNMEFKIINIIYKVNQNISGA